MDLDTANETDVREDIAVPMLAALGYVRGTQNDIRREWSLMRPYDSLGRRKKTDPILRGRADYVLVVTGTARWVLEIKAPSVPIGVDEIEQAISYARHPEVSGCYAALLNGREFVLFHNAQSSEDAPLLRLEISDPLILARKLEATLSPAAIRRDMRRPIIDTDRPISQGLRSRVSVSKGVVTTDDVKCYTNFPAVEPHMQKTAKAMLGRRANVIGGQIWRDGDSSIKAQLRWDAPHEKLLEWIQFKEFNSVEFVALASEISNDASNPTVFDVAFSVSVDAGEELFDIKEWETKYAEVPVVIKYFGQGVGFLEGSTFKGDHQVIYQCTSPLAPTLIMEWRVSGSFSVEVEAA